MKPEIRDLNADEREWLGKGLELAAQLMGREPPITIGDVQDLYDGMLERREPDANAAVALGVAFGELVRMEGAFRWVRLKDEFGEETCVAGPADSAGNRAFIAPVSMLRKRLKADQPADLAVLRDDAAKALRQAG